MEPDSLLPLEDRDHDVSPKLSRQSFGRIAENEKIFIGGYNEVKRSMVSEKEWRSEMKEGA
jgi:hypothetical protein